MKNAMIVALVILFSLPLATAQGFGDPFSPDQLDNLMAPVALYPDPLLAQVLTAATFVDEIDEASRMLRGSNNPGLIDAQPWDISVKAVAHYPSVLQMMSDKLDWTTSVGQAYVNQSTDVMIAIQRLRAMARNQGNLVSNQQQEVTMDGDYISIDPFQPQYIYVPIYDPSFVYYRRGGNFLSFSAGFAIGAWLNYDFNWRNHGIFYHGWEGGHGGWIDRSRRYTVINNTYVDNRYRNVQVNHDIVGRRVNSGNLNRYNAVHRETNYNDAGGSNAGNRVINRNLNPNDPRINANRGRPQPTQREAPQQQQQQQMQQRQMQQQQMQQQQQMARPAFDPRASQRGQYSRQQAQPQGQPPPQRQQAQPQRQQPSRQPQQQQRQEHQQQRQEHQQQRQEHQQRPQGEARHPGRGGRP